MTDNCDIDILQELFSKDNFTNTNWADKTKGLRAKEKLSYSEYLKDLFYCASCE